MFFTRSVLASAAVLSFSATTEGRVLQRKAGDHVEVREVTANEAEGHGLWSKFFGKRQDDIILDCPNDQFAALLNNNPDGSVESFCNDWLNIPPTTIIEEVTPTVTITTSDSTTTTQTTTERVLTTTTVVQTSTITAAPTVRRRMMAAAAQIESIAASIVDSVIASGAPTSTEVATSRSPNRIAAEEGLATACSCRLVSPTSSVTSTFTVPNAATATVGVRYLRVVRETETITFTSTTYVQEGATAQPSGTADASSTAAAESGSSAASGSTDTAEGSSAVDSVVGSAAATITAAPVVVTTLSENSTATATGDAAVVTAIPFSCDEDEINQSVDQVVGGLRLGYNVYCNTGFSQDRVGRPITRGNTTVPDATACAAQCSLVNAQGASDVCQNALFVPSADGNGGSCTIYAAAENDDADGTLETTPAPGSVAIVHTGTFANGDECGALNATAVAIDTSAVVASITEGGIVISTPGLVTGDAGGGVSATYVSANSTDASGYVHWSWYSVYASSTSWWAVYETSWACSATITRTIEQPATTIVEGSTITSVIVTTIIGNGFTTIISGDSTTTIRGGGGSGGTPTFVPVSTTTDGAGDVTTFFSTAIQGSTGSDGIVTPTATAGGSGNVTITEQFSTFFSTGTEGVIAPSASPSLNASITEEVIVSSGAITLTVSSANSTFFSIGTDGVLTPSETPILETIISSGAATITVGDSDATSLSIGSGGVIPPAPTSSEEEEWDTSGVYGPPKTSTIVVVSSELVTITSTGASGVETPIVSTAVSSETLVVEISNTTLSGGGQLSVFTSTATANSTGSEGIITPTVVTEIITTAAGTSNLTVILSTATANSTGTDGIIPPPSAPPGTLVVTQTVNTTLSAPSGFTIEGGGSFSTGFETGVTLSTGASGVIPPSPGFTGSTSDLPRSGSFSRPATSTTNGTASTGFITASVNSSIPVETPATTPPVSFSANITSSGFTGSTDSSNRTGVFSRSRSILVNTTSTLTLPVGTSSIEIPIVNSTIVVESTPTPSASESGSTLVVTTTANITLSVPTGPVTLIPPTTTASGNSTAPPPIFTTIITESFVSINYSTVSSFSEGDISTILFPPTSTNITISIETPGVPSNTTTAPPVSVTIPAISLNLTTSGFTGSTPIDDRTGSFSRPFTVATVNSTLPTGPTAPVTEACPSPTEFAFVTREVIITTFTVETIPVVAASCVSSIAAPISANGTLVVGINGTLPTDAPVLTSVVEGIASEIAAVTSAEAAATSAAEAASSAEAAASSAIDAATSGVAATDAAAVASSVVAAVSSADAAVSSADAAVSTAEAVASEAASAVSSVVADATATAAPLLRFRRSGVLATQEQIDAACSDSSNLVLSPALTIQPDSSTEGWFISQFDPTILVDSVTTDNGTIARFRSAFPGQTTQLSQPVTLCPGTQYELSALTRQADTRSDCTIQFRVGNDAVFTARPQEDWLERSERFTAGAGTEGASQDLTLVMSCAGFGGAAVGADDEGYMVGEIGAVSVVREELRN